MKSRNWRSCTPVPDLISKVKMFHEHTLSFFLDPPNVSLPECPSPTSNITKALTDAIAYPSVTFTYMFLAVVSLIFATVIGFRYNSVPVNVVYVWSVKLSLLTFCLGKKRKGQSQKQKLYEKSPFQTPYGSSIFSHYV